MVNLNPVTAVRRFIQKDNCSTALMIAVLVMALLTMVGVAIPAISSLETQPAGTVTVENDDTLADELLSAGTVQP